MHTTNNLAKPNRRIAALMVLGLATIACAAEEGPITEVVSGNEVQVQDPNYTVTFKEEDGTVAVGVLARIGHELPVSGAYSPYEFYLGIGGDPDVTPDFLEQEDLTFRSGVGVLYDVECGLSNDGPWFDETWQDLIPVWGYEPFHWYQTSTSKSQVTAPTRMTTFYQGHLCNEYAYTSVPSATSIPHRSSAYNGVASLYTNVPMGWRSVHTMTHGTPVYMYTRKDGTGWLAENKWQLGAIARN